MEPFLTLLDEEQIEFPSPHNALDDPNGLLALGGDLSIKRLLKAYQLGIFPWFQPDQPILWWSPNPRCVIFPDELHVSKSLQKALKKTPYECSTDTAFEEVIYLCGALRRRKEGTWISPDIIDAYCQLHEIGYAHSIEVWDGRKLVGGLYGIAMFPCFFGESMFSKATNASKIAMIALSQKLQKENYRLIDCQVENDHLLSMGARCIPREDFLSFLSTLNKSAVPHWEPGLLELTWPFTLPEK